MKTLTIYAIGNYGRRPFIRLVKRERGQGYKFFRLNCNGEEVSVEHVRTIADGKSYAANLARLSHMKIAEAEQH